MSPAPGAAAAGSATVLAVDVGGTGIKAELLDHDLATVAVATATTPPAGGPAVLDAILYACRRLLSRPEAAGVAMIGLAVPGVVDTARGVVTLATNLGWRHVDVAGPVGAALGLPVVVSHDATAAGLAEWRHGAGRGCDDVLVVVVGTGIAATAVAGGAHVRGGLGQAGELGHVVVRPGGSTCRCGRRGCLEAVASARAVAEAYAALSPVSPTGSVVSAEEVVARLGTDPVADRVWQEATDALADGLLTACALLAPARIVLGGGRSNAGEALLAPLRVRLAERARVETVPPLVLAELGDRAGVVGAGLAALDALGPGGWSR